MTSGGVYTAINGKQDKLTFDSTPTEGSSNPVTSDGIYQAIQIATNKLEGSINLGYMISSTNMKYGAKYYRDVPSSSSVNFTSEGRVTINFKGNSSSGYPSVSQSSSTYYIWLPTLSMAYNLSGSGTITIETPAVFENGTNSGADIWSTEEKLKIVILVTDGAVQSIDFNFGFITTYSRPDESYEYYICAPLTVTIT